MVITLDDIHQLENEFPLGYKMFLSDLFESFCLPFNGKYDKNALISYFSTHSYSEYWSLDEQTVLNNVVHLLKIMCRDRFKKLTYDQFLKYIVQLEKGTFESLYNSKSIDSFISDRLATAAEVCALDEETKKELVRIFDTYNNSHRTSCNLAILAAELTILNPCGKYSGLFIRLLLFRLGLEEHYHLLFFSKKSWDEFYYFALQYHKNKNYVPLMEFFSRSTNLASSKFSYLKRFCEYHTR